MSGSVYAILAVAFITPKARLCALGVKLRKPGEDVALSRHTARGCSASSTTRRLRPHQGEVAVALLKSRG